MRRRPHGRRVRFVLTVSGVLLLFAAVPGGAQESQLAFEGFNIGAAASSQTWSYNQPSAGVPSSPTGELNSAYTAATLKAGPTGYAIASLVWPGETAAKAPAFFGGPAYPVVAESFYPQGPEKASNEAGSAYMRSSAATDRSEASASASDTGDPALGAAGVESSRTASSLGMGLAVAEAKATANDIVLGGGAVTIEGVVTRAVASSDGRKGKVAGETVVTGLVVGDQPVRIDSRGLHAGGEDVDPGAAVVLQLVRQTLAQAGITVAVAAPVDLVQGASASRSLGGLIVGFEPEAFRNGVDSLPEPLRSQIKDNVPMDQTVFLSFAGAVATAQASFGLKVPELPEEAPTVAETAEETPAVSPPPQAAPVEASEESGEVLAPGAPVSFTGGFAGLPVVLGILALLLAAASSRPLAWWADRVLARRASSVCPDER